MDTVYMTAAEAADYLGLSESYLAKLRMGIGTQAGPKFLRIGSRTVRYRRRDLDEWMTSRTTDHSASAGVGCFR